MCGISPAGKTTIGRRGPGVSRDLRVDERSAAELVPGSSEAASSTACCRLGCSCAPSANQMTSRLAKLMERAYAGTIDEHLGGNSDGAVEVAAWRTEPALEEVSMAVVDAVDTVVAASLCSGSWERDVWIAYVITEPALKGRGLATVAVAESVHRIRTRSDVDIFAAVTDGNTPSERLLTSIGFNRVAAL